QASHTGPCLGLSISRQPLMAPLRAGSGGRKRNSKIQLPFFEMHPSKHRECPRIRTQGGREAGTFRFYLWYVLAGEGRKEWERSMYYLGRG
ncbi:hypothetical protein, partial [Eisenbergiella tayi]|uniref:hypothetical protein n=2 Tax=Eisenbergiella tayi TaxID=1432052 RepID=UPI002A7FC3E9